MLTVSPFHLTRIWAPSDTLFVESLALLSNHSTVLSLQTIAVLASIAGAAVGIAKFDNKFAYTHERLGIALYVVVWLAPLVGLIRPEQ